VERDIDLNIILQQMESRYLFFSRIKEHQRVGQSYLKKVIEKDDKEPKNKKQKSNSKESMDDEYKPVVSEGACS
jgi:hypothetical protein